MIPINQIRRIKDLVYPLLPNSGPHLAHPHPILSPFFSFYLLVFFVDALGGFKYQKVFSFSFNKDFLNY